MGQAIEYYQYITPTGVVYNFHNGWRCLQSFTGLGMPELQYITQQGPFQHGVSVIDWRAVQRTIQLVLRVDSCSRDDYWIEADLLVDILRPSYQNLNELHPGQFIITRPDSSQRAADVFIAAGPVFAPRNVDVWDEWGFTETLRFFAPDPSLYDPNLITELIGALGTDDELIFYNAVTGATYDSIVFRNPVTNPSGEDLVFMATVIDMTSDITYIGNWPAFPTIVITGPLNGATIWNSTTGEKIALTYNIAAGEVVTIYLDYGNKRVESDINGDITATVTEDSDLATWHLEPNPGAAGGVNTIQVTGGGATLFSFGGTSVYMNYYTRYIGI